MTSLDGLRALAILAVIVSRTAPLGGLNLESLGLEVFFTLSGFESANALLGGEDWRTFYRRWVFRVLPLYAVVLLYLPSAPVNGFPWWSLLTLNVDVAMVFTPVGWWYPPAAFALWVICVEVKGLALLPWLLRERRALRLLILLSVLSRAVLAVECSLHEHTPEVTRAVETFFLFRFDAILIGAEAALLTREGSGLVRVLSQRAPLLILVRALFVLVPAASTEPLYALAILPLGTVAATAVVVRLASSGTPARLLSWRPLAWLGSCSYEVYLLSGVIAELAAASFPEGRSWGCCGASLLGACGLAAALWYVFRQPLPPEAPPPDRELLASPAAGGALSGRARLLIALTILGVVAYQALDVRLSSLHAWNASFTDIDRSMYVRQAVAFAHGQIALVEPPSDSLLELADPYEPNLNSMVRALPDSLLYQGRFYLYWGPLPALLLTPFEMLPPARCPWVSDPVITFMLSTLLVLASAALLARLRRLVAPEAPAWTLAAWIAVCGLAFPVTFSLAHGEIYEAAIIGGQAFLVLGMYLALRGLTGPVREGALFLAALCWGAALATRVSLAPAVAALVVVSGIELVRSHRQDGMGRTLWRWALVGGPTLAAVLLMLLYNQLRFHSPLDFGRRYQLGCVNFHKLPDSDWNSPRYILYNLIRLGLDPLLITGEFPFLHPGRLGEVFRPHVYVRGYETSVCAGLLLYAPAVWYAVVPFLRASRARAPLPGFVRWWVLPGLSLSILLSLFPVLVNFGTTLRYLEDVAPVLIILAAIGGWQVGELARRRGMERRAKRIFAFLVVVTCTIGLLLGMTGEYPAIREWHDLVRDLKQLLT